MSGRASVAGVCRRSLLVCGVAVLALLLAPAAGQGDRRAGARSAQAVDPSLMRELQWRNIGPIRGGRSIAVAGSAARPSEYWFGATGGGLWKTTDFGLTWNPTGDTDFRTTSV